MRSPSGWKLDAAPGRDTRRARRGEHHEHWFIACLDSHGHMCVAAILEYHDVPCRDARRGVFEQAEVRTDGVVEAIDRHAVDGDSADE